MTKDDQTMIGGRFLPGAGEIAKRMLRKEVELEAASGKVAELERERPTAVEMQTMESRSDELQRQANVAIVDFGHCDDQGREPSAELLANLDAQLAAEQSELGTLTDNLHRIETRIAGLAADLKHSGPDRPPMTVQAELEEARGLLRREETWQLARQLLISRIQGQIVKMASEVPTELAGALASIWAN